MFCENCGASLDRGTAFCHNCGKKQGDSIVLDNNAQNLIGFSERYMDISILEAAKKSKKTSIGCMWILVIVPMVGFALAGLLIDEFAMN
ncbi:MAG: zinc ribbon domain-containing protein, partial [Clostridia bacterium]